MRSLKVVASTGIVRKRWIEEVVDEVTGAEWFSLTVAAEAGTSGGSEMAKC